MSDHACQHQAAFRQGVVRKITAGIKVRICRNRLTGNFVKGDVLRRQFGCYRHHDGMSHSLRIADGPAHDLHAAKAATNHCRPLRDAQMVGQACLTVDPVAHRYYRKVRPVPGAGIRIDGGGPGAACTAAQIIQAYNKKMIGINGFAGPDGDIPPAWFFVIHAVISGSVMITAQGMADQDGVGPVSIQLAVCFYHQVIRF